MPLPRESPVPGDPLPGAGREGLPGEHEQHQCSQQQYSLTWLLLLGALPAARSCKDARRGPPGTPVGPG